MDGIPIYYVMQLTEGDDSLNIFFLPPTFKNQSDVKIKDAVTHFPHIGNGRYYHFRFYAICDKDQKTWVDISNMNAKVPVVDNRILMKVLEVAKPEHTRIFASLYKSGIGETSAPQQEVRHSTPEQQHHSREQKQTQHHQTHLTKKSVSTDNRPQPHSHSQPHTQPKQNINMTQSQQAQKSQPAASASNDFDLLGGYNEEVKVSSTTTTTKTTTSNTFTATNTNSEEDAEKQHMFGMSREELGAYKQQKMDQAIQDKLEFANSLWKGEEQNKLDREKAYDEVEENIKKWAGKNNQRNNIRALLCTVHEVMWEGAEWQALSFSDLMAPAQIKKNYFKAITKFHPDKNQGGDYKQKYIAERVTNELNAAWDEFRKTNP